MTAADRQIIARFENVSKTYGAFTAVEAIDLDIQRGEFLTFLGPSGSGKTTTLMMLAGFDHPTSGSIELEGRRIEGLPAYRRDIGVVFQNYALFPHLTVAENLAFPLSVRRMARPEIDARVKRALAMVHLDGLGERRPAQLSGGQQQRVALARAIIFEPRLIVLDEPLGALDKNLREHMQLELKTLHRELGITMVYVTHDQAEALTMSNRVAVFNKGRIEQIDTPLGLYEHPRTAFVASFVGENNLIEGRVEDIAPEGLVLRLASGAVLRAVSTENLAVGDRAIINIRPECMSLGARDSTARSQKIAASIADITYLGSERRVLVDAEGIGRLSVKVNSGATAFDLTVGQRTQLSIPVTACKTLSVEVGGEDSLRH